MKILTVLGARPQFIKASVVSRAIQDNSNMDEKIIHTGQHYDTNMSSIFFDEMEIPKPDYQLKIKGDDHGSMTGNIMIDMEPIIKKEAPNAVIVYGDTNTTLAAALVSKKLHLPLIHIEAGLRSYNMKMPEEINRIVTDRISDICFCPTQLAYDNLVKENYGEKLELVGDVMYDATLFYAELSEKRSTIIKDNDLAENEFVLCTVHRAENTDSKERLEEIFNAINHITKDKKVVLPLHPRTQKMLKQFGIKTEALVIDPVGYFDMQTLIKNCSVVMTDSGGLQKESYFYNKFCITLRDETEWVELVDNGYNFITGANGKTIIFETEKAIGTKFESSDNLYGDGTSAQKIVNIIDKNI
ncbi:MAG: UDP-N-acetylglucosamine 2-epimerase (non-hydrolyzing) [Planctomycetota bacterium]|nr:MAG: UDP-N-acetylglucosamine 2-epimerase (non-hydrolyzing) [Planctomycetota bacterium]